MKRILAALTLLVLATVCRADDPALTPLVRIDPTIGYERTSMYDRWQYYGVDRYGRFRPRVVLDTTMTYYLVNGRPYPLMPVRPMDYIAHIVD